MVLKAEDILPEIQSAGYEVTGGREWIDDGRDGPLRVTARNIETGQRHTTIVHDAPAVGVPGATGADGESQGSVWHGRFAYAVLPAGPDGWAGRGKAGPVTA